MSKLIEFAKNNTMIVAGVAAVVLFIAMNSLTSCVAHGGDDGASQQQEQAVSGKKTSSGKSSETKKVNLTDVQKSAIGNYSDDIKTFVDDIENIKWANIDGSGSLDIKNNCFIERYGESTDSKTKSKNSVVPFAITASDKIDLDQTGGATVRIFTIVDKDGTDHILKFTTVNPNAYGNPGDTYYELSSDLFKNENGYTNNRSAETAKIVGLDDQNLSKAVDGRTKELKKSLIDYLIHAHSTTTELDWNGQVTSDFQSKTRFFYFTVKNAATTEDDGSTSSSLVVTYHTDTHEFEEADGE